MCEHARSMQGLGVGEVPTSFHFPVFNSLRSLLGVLQDEVRPVAEHTPEHVAHISDILRGYSVADDEWKQFCSFHDTKYTRHLVAHDEKFSVLLLCWNKGQRSPVHDHAGSSCWVKVLQGHIRETRFAEQGPGEPLLQVGQATCGTEDVCYINDSQALHEMANPSDSEVCVTLHVYSPAFFECKCFCQESGESRVASMLAAAAPPREIIGLEKVAPKTQEIAPSNKCAGTSLKQLCDALDSPSLTQEDVVETFRTTKLSQLEWSNFAHFSDFRFMRLLVHQNPKYSLLVLCWLPGQKTPPHDHHGSSSWVRVLSGELTFSVFTPDTPMRKLTPASDLFVEDAQLPIHVLGNDSKSFAVSLHLYNPPYTELHYGSPLAERCATIPVVQCQRAGTSKPCQQVAPCRFSNFDCLLERVTGVFETTEPSDLEGLSAAVMEAMESTTFCPNETQRYWDAKHRTGVRIRLFESMGFNVVLNLWEPGHRSVAHDHNGSFAWVKVIEGTVQDIVYDADPALGRVTVQRNARLQEGEACFYGQKAIHAMRNASDVRAVTLHVYAGACGACRWYSPDNVTPVTVSSHSSIVNEWGVRCGDGSFNFTPNTSPTLKPQGVGY